MMFCRVCGNSIADTDLFCQRCGNSTNYNTDYTQNMNSNWNQTGVQFAAYGVPQKKKSKHKVLVIVGIVVAILLLIIGLIIGIGYWIKNSKFSIEATEEELLRGYSEYSTAEDIYNKESSAADITEVTGYGTLEAFNKDTQVYDYYRIVTYDPEEMQRIECKGGEIFEIEIEEINYYFFWDSHTCTSISYYFDKSEEKKIYDVVSRIYGKAEVSETVNGKYHNKYAWNNATVYMGDYGENSNHSYLSIDLTQ